MVTDKKSMLFNRNGEGQLIAREYTLESLEGKPVIKIRPVTRGMLMEIQELAQSSNTDERLQSDKVLIMNGLVDPVLTDEEYKDLQPQWAVAIATAILAISTGVSEEKIQASVDKLDVVGAEEEYLKKN